MPPKTNLFIFKNYNINNLIVVVSLFFTSWTFSQLNRKIILDTNSPYIISQESVGNLSGGDTIFISSERTRPLRFKSIEGNASAPIVVINQGGQVKIDGITDNAWGALVFENCKYIKLSGKGHPSFKYGFSLSAMESGVAFSELSSDCEVENVKISHEGFFGIFAKKDYNSNPPNPAPVFNNLIIHDCFIENVSEGMYIGETKSPGMEFKNLKIYNNIVRNTQRESIQIANAVENVEIYNNTLINAGLENEKYHKNNLQIGDNSVASIYNNIFKGAPDYGVIIMGKGNVDTYNNYFENNKGIFIDNRIFSDTTLSLNIELNYFKSLTGQEVIRNMNEKNPIKIQYNVYDTSIDFYRDLNSTDNEIISENFLETVAPLLFVDSASSNYALTEASAIIYNNIGATGGSEFLKTKEESTTSKQIPITSDMITDNVDYGSIHSPLYLFDEQDISTNENPKSISWKPAYSMQKDAYYTTIDLGKEHHISEIRLHDMHNTQNLTVEYFDGEFWQHLFTESCDGFEVWKTHQTNSNTKFLRFAMYDGVFASVNEILIFGYPLEKISNQIVVTPEMVSDKVPGGSIFSPQYLFDEQNISLEANEHPISKSWKPFYNNNKAPYYSVIDLKNTYQITKIALHDMHNTNNFVVETSKDGITWQLLFIENCDTYKNWKIHEVNIATNYIRVTMLDSPYASINEILLYGYSKITLPESTSSNLEDQIIISPNMVQDLVSGGSVDSPLFLFDEQLNVNPELDEHPTSKNWKPFYTDKKAPYLAEIDLQKKYRITKVYLHDMHSTNNFNIQYATDNKWKLLVNETCDAYNTWKVHDVDVVTDKIRLSILDNPNAGVNEIIFVGKPVENDNIASKSIPIKTFTKESSRLTLYPNPVKQHVNIKLPLNESLKNMQIEVRDLLGKVVYTKSIASSFAASTVSITASELDLTKGLYLLTCKNDRGYVDTIKFYKQ